MGIIDWVGEIVGITAPSTLEIVFMMCAFLGTAFFLILMAMMMIGDILGGAFDSVFDTDISMDSDLSFELFSIQGFGCCNHDVRLRRYVHSLLQTLKFTQSSQVALRLQHRCMVWV